jgi:RNA polymerase sigma factor (sigma-70 family)
LLEDDEIIQGCQNGDRKAQQELFLKYSRKMYGFCLRYSNNPDDANDLLQDGFIKVFDNIKSFKGDSNLSSWMSRVFINLAITKFRKKSVGPKFVDMDDADVADDSEDNMELPVHDVKHVMKCMSLLPEKYRLVLNMYAIDKMSHRDIAAQLGITEGTSKSQLSRARQMLKDLLEKN